MSHPTGHKCTNYCVVRLRIDNESMTSHRFVSIVLLYSSSDSRHGVKKPDFLGKDRTLPSFVFDNVSLL